MQGLVGFVQHNLTHVAPILLVFFFAVAVTLERWRSLFWVYPMRDREQFYERLQAFIMANRLKDAIALCNMHQEKPLVQVVRAGLIRAHQPEEMISDGLAMAVNEAQHRIQQRTPYLSTIANVATLLGLFGTIMGLIQSFEAVGRADPSQKSALLAAGISTAMNATLMGLGVAIPCMVIFSYLMNRTNKHIAEVNHAAIHTIDMIRQRLYSTEKRQERSGADQAA